MPPFTLKLGSVDLAPYLRVGNDEGFDPYDAGGFEEPAFIDNPFGEGQGLANVDSRNREMAWPLYLNASTKDALHDLVGDINREIRYATRPLRVEWKDQDASASTFFDVEFARFDPNFRVRPSAQGWLAGVLRVWCKPYGHTGTYRTIGTGIAATNGIGNSIRISTPSVAGDVAPDVEVWVSAPTYASGHEAHYTIVAPVPTQRPMAIPVASMTGRGEGTIVGASGAVSSQVYRLFFGPGSAAYQGVRVVNGGASRYLGRNRIIALIRPDVSATHTFQSLLFDPNVATSALNSTLQVDSSVTAEWMPFDLGVLTIPSSIVIGKPVSPGVIIDAVFTRASAAASSHLDIGCVYLVPEERSVISRETDVRQSGAHAATRVIRSNGDSIRYSSDSTLFYSDLTGGAAQIDSNLIGRLGIELETDEVIEVVQFRKGNTPQAVEFNAEIRARERFTFAR